MAVTTSSNKTAKNFIAHLSKDYPDFKFKAGNQEYWSPQTSTITFNPKHSASDLYYGVLHELAHAILGHSSYHSDFELLKMESDAWELAAQIARSYGIKIDEEHIQNCLDTYRDWLHRRSTCPSCATHVLQKDASHYECYNCKTTWRVSSGRFVRSYRKTLKTKTA